MLKQLKLFPETDEKTPLQYLFTRNHVNEAIEKMETIFGPYQKHIDNVVMRVRDYMVRQSNHIQNLERIVAEQQQTMVAVGSAWNTRMLQQNNDIQELKRIVEGQQKTMEAVGSAWNTRTIVTAGRASTTSLKQLSLKF